MEQTLKAPSGIKIRPKFLIGGGLILAAVLYLIISSTKASAQYFLTLDELKGKGQSIIGKDVRISGAVVGDTIKYDANTLTLTFDVAQVPADNNLIDKEGGLAAVLHAAVIDPKRTRIPVVYNGAKPDLLKNEAQAIMTGHLNQDGTFYASELLLKCPTKYQESLPGQAQ